MNEKIVVIATTNKNKIIEIEEILKEVLPDTIFKSLLDFKCDIDIEEDADTFEGNAIKKAKEYSEILGYPCIADDSGLCIEELDDWPGVKTARFLGENATARERNEYILEKMKNLEKSKRIAKHVTNIVFYKNIEEIIVSEGIVEGYIMDTIKGENGFGFDEIFEVDGKSMAEYTLFEKNKFSARRIAINKLKEKILQK